MAFLLPIGFLLLQSAVLLALPEFASETASIFMTLAPLLAAWALLVRARAEAEPARSGWQLVAAALVIWAGGAGVNLWQDVVLDAPPALHRASLLGFNLAAVPLLYLLASESTPRVRGWVGGTDAVLALVLGGVHVLFAWPMPAAPLVQATASVDTLLWLYGAQNLCVLVAALARWLVCADASENDLFRAIAVYALAALAVGHFNHQILAGGGVAPQAGLFATGVFALLAGLALAGSGRWAGVLASSSTGRSRVARAWQPSAGLVRSVRSVQALFLAGALLLVALLLIRVDHALGTAAVLIALLGYVLRSTVAQVRNIDRVDGLPRDRSEPQAVVWTDALTGIANRRFLDHALSGAGRRELLASQPLSVLMIDIDHFKRLNEACGASAGDACLREVAQALQRALVRPGDVLARYGGEEFIVLLQDAGSTGAIVVAERLRRAVQSLRIAHPDHSPGVVTVSIGAASAASQGRASTASLIEVADKALYEAKSSGRNQVRGLTVALP